MLALFDFFLREAGGSLLWIIPVINRSGESPLNENVLRSRKKSICRRPEGTRQSHGAHVCGLRRRLGHVASASGRLVHQASIHPSAAAAMPRRTFVNKCYVQRRVPAAAAVSPSLLGCLCLGGLVSLLTSSSGAASPRQALAKY